MTRETTAVPLRQVRMARSTDGNADAAPAAHTSWLVCRAGALRCALPVQQVVEIMRFMPLKQVAGAPPYVRGVSIIRGMPVPVVDMGLIAGGAPTRGARLVAVRVAARIVALAVDEVIGIAAFAAGALHQLPPLLHDAAADTIAALGAADAELVFFLRTGRLVPEDLFAHLDADGAPQ
jgi:purine-binding chemotaxis protein CheW